MESCLTRLIEEAHTLKFLTVLINWEIRLRIIKALSIVKIIHSIDSCYFGLAGAGLAAPLLGFLFAGGDAGPDLLGVRLAPALGVGAGDSLGAIGGGFTSGVEEALLANTCGSRASEVNSIFS